MFLRVEPKVRRVRPAFGRIYPIRGGPDDDLRWFSSMTINGPATRSNRVATLEEAKAQFLLGTIPRCFRCLGLLP
jgi:hypothetical protein